MIDFYEANDKFGELSNYYVLKSKIMYAGNKYASSEHLYQSLKFQYDGASPETVAYAETIRLAKTPNIAKILARQETGGGYAWRVALNPIIAKSLKDGVIKDPDWESIKDEKMELVLRLKFEQDLHCKSVLLSTGDAKLAEHTHRDKYWGDGGELRTGKNVLGNLLMKTREKICQDLKETKKRNVEEIEQMDDVKRAKKKE